jgi:TPP-dependent trihydroxycyclohexane-1,2-dione (THcHDO) dehydratase
MLTTGLPAIAQDFSDEPSILAAGLREADLATMVAIPVLTANARLAAVVAWHFQVPVGRLGGTGSKPAFRLAQARDDAYLST